ncbi:MAG: MBL fold metallo-hydrolase [Prevotella sp.]|nr:MBL fold metallo-hydrolase [Bacteroides sp.]MCM1366122.1 MBL fold metallo-hydrolase [Prevotella sp.]MCM1437531.1 MBL fold metallo-hydrolase [Prevotella sp.]
MGRLLLTYIWHDGFILESDMAFFIFDLWIANSNIESFFQSITNKIRRQKKSVYVLVSHHHKDHFDKRIFNLLNLLPDHNIHFILSHDTCKSIRYMLRPDSIFKGQKIPQSNYTELRPGDVYTDNLVTISAFASTDIGNSYILQSEGKIIFHAGDLNAWVWKEESTQKEVATAIRDFEKILYKIAESFSKVDLAMFPVDSRIGKEYWEGASRFVRTIKTKRFIPMHFELADNESQRRQRQQDAQKFESYANPDFGDYISLTSPGDSISFI